MTLTLLAFTAGQAFASGQARPAPARQFFAPAREKAKQRRKAPEALVRLQDKVKHAPVMRQVLHPVVTAVSGYRGAKRVGHLAGSTANLKVRHRAARRGTASSSTASRRQIKLSRARQKVWSLKGGKVTARDILADDIFVASGEATDQPLSEADLEQSLQEVSDSLKSPGALLPAGSDVSQVTALMTAARRAVSGTRVFGAPNGINDILANPVVSGALIEDTLEAARRQLRKGSPGGAELAWLTSDQKLVLEDLLRAKNRAPGALTPESFLERTYERSAEVAEAAHGGYRTVAFTMKGDRADLPLEIQAALGQDPALADELTGLEDSGIKLQVRIMRKTPPGVRSAALEQTSIGEEIEFGPLVNHVLKGERMDARPTRHGIERTIAAGKFSYRRKPTRKDLEDRLKIIDDAVDQTMVIEGAGLKTSAQIATLRRVNRRTEKVRRHMALHRLVYDSKFEAGEGARALLKSVVGLAGTASILQLLGQAEGAILAAEAGEDLVQGGAEGAGQAGQDVQPKELWRRATKVAAGAALATSVALAPVIHNLAHHGLGWQAGLLMGFGSMALSSVVFFNAVELHMERRVGRLREGKIAGKIAPLMFNKKFQRKLKRISLMPKARRAKALRDAARSTLEPLTQGDDALLSRAEMNEIVVALEREDYKTMREMAKRPHLGSIFLAGWREALGTPTRKSLGQGMVITILASTAVGTLGLLAGPAWGMALAVVAASGEGIWGYVRSHMFDGENARSRDRGLKAMADGREAPPQGVIARAKHRLQGR